jgi:hypothetical protein
MERNPLLIEDRGGRLRGGLFGSDRMVHALFDPVRKDALLGDSGFRSRVLASDSVGRGYGSFSTVRKDALLGIGGLDRGDDPRTVSDTAMGHPNLSPKLPSMRIFIRSSRKQLTSAKTLLRTSSEGRQMPMVIVSPL